MTDSLLPVILCGGAGTRLWPLSRGSHPKQFHALAGDDSLLQDTAKRLWAIDIGIPIISAPLLVCNVEHRFLVASQLQQLGIDGAQILLEPVGRNTAPALTIAALQARKNGADPVLVAMPADHVVKNLAAFHAAVRIAYTSALNGHMVVFGVAPDRSETGYGYIQHGDSNQDGTMSIRRFVEKPDIARANAFLAEGNYLWNSGLFVVRASKWLEAIRQYRPDIFAACEKTMRDAREDLDFIRPDPDAFFNCPSDSIDYAVMERLPNKEGLAIEARVVPLKAGWSDLGAWDALWALREHDCDGNAAVGQVVQHGCTQSLFYSSNRLIAGVGLEHVAIIETSDAILAVNMHKSQDVKHVISKLNGDSQQLAQSHRKVYRPWGWYDCIDLGTRFKVKRLVVNPGASLSLQKHQHRAEHWVVVKGTADVTKGQDNFRLEENQSIYISVQEIHRLSNPGQIPLEVIEIQTGNYLEEDDIVRYSSHY